MPTMVRIRLHPRLVVRTFGAGIAVLCVGHLLSQLAKYQLGVAFAYGLVDLFDMDVEGSLPTFFAGFQLLVCSLVLALIGLVRREAGDSFARHWLALSVMFLLLAIDELVSVHELSHRVGWELAPSFTTGIFHWIWIIPGSLLVLVVAISFARFVFSSLPPLTRDRTIIGAALFVGGAIGVEMLEARHVHQNGMENLTMGIYVLVEEALEKVGILVFLSGILDYLRVAVVSFVVDAGSVEDELPQAAVAGAA